jgi:hypothetical protein
MEVKFHVCVSSVMQAMGGVKRQFVGFRRLSSRRAGGQQPSTVAQEQRKRRKAGME